MSKEGAIKLVAIALVCLSLSLIGCRRIDQPILKTVNYEVTTADIELYEMNPDLFLDIQDILSEILLKGRESDTLIWKILQEIEDEDPYQDTADIVYRDEYGKLVELRRVSLPWKYSFETSGTKKPHLRAYAVSICDIILRIRIDGDLVEEREIGGVY